MTDEHRHYFSNGAEWELWESRWCQGCVGDHEAHVDDNAAGCPLILSMMLGVNEAALVGDGLDLECKLFEPCACATRAATQDMSYTGTGQLLTYHPPSQCAGSHCPFHNPSDHHMVEWATHFRTDRAPLIERICPHGIGHPDPDSVAYLQARWPDDVHDVHGCDGCCMPPCQ